MSRIHSAPGQISVASWSTLQQAAGRLAAIAAKWIASTMSRRVERRALRELAALDDRALADIGLVRADLVSLREPRRDAVRLGPFSVPLTSSRALGA